jgi:hypothetical protein
MLPQHVDQGAKQVLVSSKTIQPRGCEAAKEPGEVPGQDWVTRHRAHDFDLAHDLLFYLASQKDWVEIEHPPPTHVAIQGHSVVHLAGIHHDHITG